MLNVKQLMENKLSVKFLLQYVMMYEWVNLYLNSLTDEEFRMELSPGKNHGVWILGHMITSDDDFSVYMGKGELLFPEYRELFGQGSKVQSVGNYPGVATLRQQWNMIIEKNKNIYEELRDEEFDDPHGNLSEDKDGFFKNKGEVIMAWQLHQLYHTGQLGILVSRVGRSKF